MSEQAALDKKAIRKEILALIIPIILESIFVYLAGIVSASLVGHLSGLAVATQGLANRITGLLNVVWGAVRIGSMVYYVNLIGEGKYGELKQGFKNICTVTLGIAIGFVLILFLFPSQILSFFTEDVELIASAKSYLHITLLALPLWVMTKMNSAMFNAMGDTKTPMYLQVLINVVNIALGYLLIFILKWDFYGAAIATAVSQIAGGGVGIILLNRKEYFRQAGKTGWGISDKESIKETLLKSIPVGLEDGMWQIYAIIMTKFLLTYGTNAYAGFQLATAAEEITELPVIGFTVAATTLAGRAKSQKSGPLFREYFKQQLWMNGTISALCTLAMICLPSGFMSIVTNDPALKEVGAVYLMIMGAILIPQNLQRTLTGTIYGGIGNTKATMIITVIGTWCIRIPMAALATYVFKWPLWTLWMFVGADQVARFLMMAFYVKRNKVLYCIENGTGEKKEDNN